MTHYHRDPRRWRRQLRDGDVDAFASLFRAEVDRVHRVASGICGDTALAEDIVSEAFLTAWRRRDTIVDSDEPLGPWLLAIAARSALNVTRGRLRQRRFLARHGHRLSPIVSDFSDTVSSRLDDADTLERTRRSLEHLSSRELEVLSLCVWSGLSTREAARALGVAEGTVRSRLSRARTRLRFLVTAPGDDPPQGLSPERRTTSARQPAPSAP